jgi:threonine synthase
VRGKAILHAIRDTKGVVTTVTDEAVWNTVEKLGRQGVYVEPTAAAAPSALAALLASGVIGSGARVAIMLTGNGLKATDKIVEHLAASVPVPA